MDRETHNKLVSAAFVVADSYVDNPDKKAVLFSQKPVGRDYENAKADLKKSYHNNESIKAAISEIIAHFVDAAPAHGEGRVTYLSGAPGSKQMLLAAARDSSNMNPQLVALREALQTSALFDYQEAKKLFTLKTGESLDGEAYAKFRPLFSGMDSAINAYAKETNLNRLVDNALPPKEIPPTARVFAIALTPAQAAIEADKLKIPLEEARNYAIRFSDYFNQVRENGPDITVFDTKLNPIFVRENGETKIENKEALALWLSAFKPPAISQANDNPLPTMTAFRRAGEAANTISRA